MGERCFRTATGKPYVKNHAPSNSYPDSSHQGFTDGLEGTHYSDGRGFGCESANLGVANGGTGNRKGTVDLMNAVSADGAELVSGCGDTLPVTR